MDQSVGPFPVGNELNPISGNRSGSMTGETESAPFDLALVETPEGIQNPMKTLDGSHDASFDQLHWGRRFEADLVAPDSLFLGNRPSLGFEVGFVDGGEIVGVENVMGKPFFDHPEVDIAEAVNPRNGW